MDFLETIGNIGNVNSQSFNTTHCAETNSIRPAWWQWVAFPTGIGLQMFPCVWHCDWEPYWVFECLLLHNRAKDFWDSQSESLEFLQAPPHELEVTLTLTTAQKLKWDSKGREGHLRRGGYQCDTSFCSRLQGLSFAFCYATEKARHGFCHATLKKAQVALDSLSKVAGPVGSSPEI